MEILRRTEGINLFYEIPMQKESYVTEMLQNNSFKTLPPVYLLRVGDNITLSYIADGLQSFANRFSREEPDWSRIKELVKGIAESVRELQEYLLPPEGLVLSTSCIFREPVKGGYRFLYCTTPEKSFSASMKHLFEEIMPIYSHGDRDGVVRFYELYARFLDEQFTPAMLLQLVEGWNGRMLPAGREGEYADDVSDEPGQCLAGAYGGEPMRPVAVRKSGVYGKDASAGKNDVIRRNTAFGNSVGSGKRCETGKSVGSFKSAVSGNHAGLRKASDEPPIEKGAFPKWLVVMGIVVALTGVVVYLIFGRAAVKGIALMGVIYVVMIILHIHSKNGDIEKDSKDKQLFSRRGETNGGIGDYNTALLTGWEDADAGSDFERKSIQGINMDKESGSIPESDSEPDADLELVSYNASDQGATIGPGIRNGTDKNLERDLSRDPGMNRGVEAYLREEMPQNYPVTDVLRLPSASFTRLIPAENQKLLPITLNNGVCRIGRVPEENEYCIPSPGISRNHARISCGQGTVFLQDLHSTNGTYVNRERIRDDNVRELHYGDVVSFAGEVFYCV